jgi:hypothetical protein
MAIPATETPGSSIPIPFNTPGNLKAFLKIQLGEWIHSTTTLETLESLFQELGAEATVDRQSIIEEAKNAGFEYLEQACKDYEPGNNFVQARTAAVEIYKKSKDEVKDAVKDRLSNESQNITDGTPGA